MDERATPVPNIAEMLEEPAPLAVGEAIEPIEVQAIVEDVASRAPEVSTPVPIARMAAPGVSAPAAPVETPTPSSLQAEVALLSRAQRAIADHDGPSALRHLDELTRRFPEGEMEEERDAARVFALCESGRADEARTAAQRFLVERPTSPLRARVSSACP